MTLQSKLKLIQDWLADPEGRVLKRAIVLSLLVWLGASTANAMVDLGAVLHGVACPDHAAWIAAGSEH